MPRRKKTRKRQKRKPAAQTVTHVGRNASPNPSPSHQFTTVVGGIVVGVIITLTLHPLKLLLERSNSVVVLEDALYDVLQMRIASKLKTKDLPVVVLDISDLPSVPFTGPDGKNRQYTSRVALQQRVEAILGQTPPPLAVGIDVDFSSPDDDFYSPEDAAFLEFYLNKKKQYPDIPLVVGASTSLGRGQKVLTDPKYAALAAFVAQRKPPKYQSYKLMNEWLEVPVVAPDRRQGSQRFPSLASALARKPAPEAPWPNWFATNVFYFQDNGLSAKEFVVDYAPLEALAMGSTISSTNSRKIVILGRTSDTTDTFSPPGQLHNEYPGMYTHACAVYTLLLPTWPLCEVTELGKLMLDFAFAFVVFLSVALVRSRWHKRSPDKMHNIFTLLSMTAVFLFGFVLVHVTRLIWNDFILVMIALAVHNVLERTAAFESVLALLPQPLRSLLITIGEADDHA